MKRVNNLCMFDHLYGIFGGKSAEQCNSLVSVAVQFTDKPHPVDHSSTAKPGQSKKYSCEYLITLFNS